MKHSEDKINRTNPEMENVLKGIEAEIEAGKKLESFSSGGAEWDRSWNIAAENHAKFGAFVWVVYGIYALFFAHKLEVTLIGFMIFFPLYFFVGSALAAMSAMIPCAPMYISNTLYHKFRNPMLNALATILTMFTWVFVIIWIIFVANWCIGIMNGIF